MRDSSTSRCAPAARLRLRPGSWPSPSRCGPRSMTQRGGGDLGSRRAGTPTRAWQLFIELGDAWGVAEALSGRGETLELTRRRPSRGRRLPGGDRATSRNWTRTPRSSLLVPGWRGCTSSTGTRRGGGGRAGPARAAGGVAAGGRRGRVVRSGCLWPIGAASRRPGGRGAGAIWRSLREEFASRRRSICSRAWSRNDGLAGPDRRGSRREALTRIRVGAGDDPVTSCPRWSHPQVPVIQLMTAARALAALGGAAAPRRGRGTAARRVRRAAAPASSGSRQRAEDREAGEAAVRAWLDDGSLRAGVRGGRWPHRRGGRRPRLSHRSDRRSGLRAELAPPPAAR